MALTVFVETMGFFHKGSAGFGVAPLDVCLSPPPGPVPIPYTNVLFAKDLIKGCLTVDVSKRLTMKGVKAHAWVAGAASKEDITPALGQLRLFNARRKLRAGMLAAIAANKLGDALMAAKSG